jgi:hypothetical protein
MFGVGVDYSVVRDVNLTASMSIAIGSIGDDEILQQCGWTSLREL